MGIDIGFNSQTPSLPEGGGAITGLGETFTPDLSSGTGSYTIRLDSPNGPNDIDPQLALRYDSGNGNGPFGLGFSLPLPRLLRSIGRSFPRYNDSDPLMLEGAGELLRLADGSYRPEVDGSAWRAEAVGKGFRVTDREGLHYFLGTDAAARLTGPAPTQVFAWHLERIEDALGNSVQFHWRHDGGQLYLDTMSYGPYQMQFMWEARPDIIRSGRAGFLIVTALRCAAIELHLPGSSQPLLRRWTLMYAQDDTNGTSLLRSVTLSGFDEAMTRLDTPPLQLGYSGFAARALTHFTSVDPGIEPGPLQRTGRRMELVDWDGDGLPDLLEIAVGGTTRLWPNLGECMWGRPRPLPSLPLFASAEAALAFADMNGDGVADLIRTDQFADGYIPRIAGGGFDRPVTWREVPGAARRMASNSRLTDLDGDGRVDLLVSTNDGLELYYRTDADSWTPMPQMVPRGTAPVLNLADPHVFLADMSGSGSSDLVRVDGRGIIWWPYLGFGQWAAPVTMQNPPDLPFDVRTERLFLSDVDGDGCADLIYLDQGRVVYWINQSGNGFSAPHVIDYVPTGSIQNARLADMRGSGTAGLLWSTSGPFERGTIYYYLDFSGDAKPHLLSRIDNGIGLVTEIDYTTSARVAAEGVRANQPWSTFLPLVVPVIAQITTRDHVTGQTASTRYRYFDGRYDGILREFAGFGQVEQDQLGDTSAPTLRTTSWFHLGVDPNNPGEPPEATRRLLRAIRGRLLRRERSSPDALDSAAPFDRLEQDWIVDEEHNGATIIYVPRLGSMRETNLNGEIVASSITTTNLNWDAFGNVTETVQTSSSVTETQTLRTVNAYTSDAAGRFNSRLWRTRQFDTTNLLVADTITEFDHANEGNVGTQGLVTRRSALVLSDAMALDIYGATQPDFVALGYHRRTDSNGWWVFLSSYERVVSNVGGLSGSVTGPRGAITGFRFDPTTMFPTDLTPPTSNTLHAIYDLRTATLSQLTDAAGSVYVAKHDALARIVTTIDPGDTDALPTSEYAYESFTLPTEVRHRQRAESSTAETINTRERFDGAGRMIERRVTDEIGEVILAFQQYNARGLLAQTFQESRATSAAYTALPPTLPHTSFTYDALGRITQTVSADGSVHSLRYGSNWIEEADEESNRTDADALHAGIVTRRLFDATGRVRTIEQQLGVRIVSTHYEYDIKGNLLRHVDALGNIVQFTYDLMGRTLRVMRPEQTSITVLDAAGNPVETRSGGLHLLRDYDLANRLIAERTDGVAPVVRYIWHDVPAPVPPDAAAFSVGHILRIEDAAGITRFGYDARGRVIRKRWSPVAGGTEHVLDFEYRSDDQPSRIIYPDGGAGRLALRHQYNVRGLLNAVPSVVEKFNYDLSGRRVAAQYANGTIETSTYDLRGRLTGSTVSGPDDVLRTLNYELDRVGNLTGVVSPDPKLAAHYVFDDFYRLTQATRGSGESWTYAYDDAGRLTHKSDVGDYHYGEAGLPATCLSSAGADTFTYSPRGEMHNTPWGVQSFDVYGHLINIVGRDGLGRVDFTYDYAGRRVTAHSQGNAAPAVDLVTPDNLYSLEAGHLVLHLAGCARLAAGITPVYLHRDHLGGLALVTDHAGAVVERRYYDPYGALLERIGPAIAVPEGFGGGVTDDWTGLIYLRARYYHPRLGQFISSDPVVGNMLDPLAWASYAYCRSNPVSYTDPSGRSFWRVFILVVAIVALVALTIVTLGASTPLAVAIGIGVLAGGVVGGISAARAKGDAGDIVTGILVGMAVGGWGAFLGGSLSGAIVGKLGSGIVGSAVAGGLSGAVNGTAMGFAAGFGAKSEAAAILNLMWQSALAGLVIGAALGALSGAVSSGDIKKPDLTADYDKKVNEFSRTESGAKAPAPNMSGSNPDLPARTDQFSPPSPTSPSAAAGKAASWASGPLVKSGEYYGGLAGAMLPVQVLAADLAGGTWGVFHDDITTYLRRHDVKLEV